MDLETVLDAVAAELNATTPRPDLKLSIIPKHLDGFFAPVVDGAENAIVELGVDGAVNSEIFDSNEAADAVEKLMVETQVDYVQAAIDAKYDGIALAPMNNSLVPYIDAAVESGAVTVTFDNDEPTSKRHVYIGTVNEDAGMVAAATLVRLMQSTTGTVVVLGYADTDWQAGLERTVSASDILGTSGYNAVVVTTGWDNQIDVAALTEALQNANPPAVGMLGLFSNSYLCATAAQSAGADDTLTIVGFDMDPETVAYMKDGLIAATHAQRLYYTGYLTAYFLTAANLLGLDKTKALFANIMVEDDVVYTGLDVVEADSLEEYSAFLSTLSSEN